MSEQKTLYLPPSFDVQSYLEHRVETGEREEHDRIRNNFGNFAGFGGPGGMGQVNPFNLPGSANFPGQQMLSNANTIFNNLRWYFVSNFRQMLSEAYVELGLVQTIVDVPVDDAFRGGVEIKTKQLSPEQIEQLQISIDRDDDINTIAQTAKWNRLFGGAGTLILTDQDPRTPLNLDEITEDSPLEFRAVDLWELFWDKQNTEGYDPALQTQEFEFYNYYGEIVHKSRVMRMKGKTAPSFVRPRLRGWGFSEVEKLVRSINQYLKATDLAFEVLDEFKLDVYRIKNLVNTLLSPQGANKVKQRIAVANQIKNYQNAIVMDVEDEYEQKQLSFSGLAETMGQIRMQVAADMRIPMTKLFGISAAGFNSGEDDIEVYNAMVESEVRNKVKYQVLRVLEIKCQKLFGIIPDDLSVSFKPLRIMSGVDEEAIKTSKFNRLVQAQTSNLITPEQFADACNRDQLLGIQLEKIDMLNPNPNPFDTVAEEEDTDPDDPKSTNDPGANREDTCYPKAGEKGGLPKGLKKQSPPSSSDEQDEDETVPTKTPFGKKGTKPPSKATNPDEDAVDEPQRKAEWRDEKTPEEEMEDHDLKLEKPKKTVGGKDAPESPTAEEGKEAKSGKVPPPKKSTPPEPKGQGTKRRINNKDSKTQAAIVARTTGNQPGIVFSRQNGEARTARDANGKIVKRGDKVTYRGAVGVVDGIDSDNSIRVAFPQVKGEYQKFTDGKWTPDWTETGAEGVRKVNSGEGQFPHEDRLGYKEWQGEKGRQQFPSKGDLDPFNVPAAEADLVQHEGTNYQQPDDRIVDNRKDNNPQYLDKPFKKKRCVVIGVIVGKNEWILTGKRRDTGLWTSPGGHAEQGEDLRDAAVRELEEEAGICVDQSQLIPFVSKRFSYPDHETLVQCYKVYLGQRVLARTTQDPDEEVEKWRWVPLSTKSLELRTWNRQADEDILIKELLG